MVVEEKLLEQFGGSCCKMVMQRDVTATRHAGSHEYALLTPSPWSSHEVEIKDVSVEEVEAFLKPLSAHTDGGFTLGRDKKAGAVKVTWMVFSQVMLEAQAD